jgi:hypothetical protein
MAEPDDDDARRARARAKKAREKERGPDTSSAPASEDAADEGSSVEGAAKRKWTLDDVVAALRARPRLLPDGTVYVNEKLLQALAKVGARAASPVLEVLSDTRWTARWAALAALQRIALRDDAVDAAAILPRLVEALEDEKPRVRAKAVEAIAALRKAKDAALPALIKALGDQDAEVSRLAVMHVLELGLDPKELTERLVEVLTSKRSVYLRVGVLTVLLHLGKNAKAAVPYLIEALEDPAAEVREYANLALTAIRTPSMRLQVIRTASMRLKAIEGAPSTAPGKGAEAKAAPDEDDEEDEDDGEEASEKPKKRPLVRRRRRRLR